MGKGSQICEDVLIGAPWGVSLGKNVRVNQGVILQAYESATIEVGDNVTFSFRAMVLTGGIDLERLHGDREHQTGSIVIQDHAWIGAGAIVLPGVTVGYGAVVAAGAVVTRDVAAHTMVAGVPAQAVKTLPTPSDVGPKSENA